MLQGFYSYVNRQGTNNFRSPAPFSVIFVSKSYIHYTTTMNLNLNSSIVLPIARDKFIPKRTYASHQMCFIATPLQFLVIVFFFFVAIYETTKLRFYKVFINPISNIQ